MTDHDPDHDDVLKELNAALQVEPSRAFASGVRARVSGSRTQTRRIWWGLAAAATVGLATVALWRPSVEVPASAPVAQAQLSAPMPMAPIVAPPVEAAEGTTARRTNVARATAATVSLASAEPRLEVITNQGVVLRELWAAVGAGPMVETVAEVAVPVGAAEAKPITPIVVDPIVVPPIVVSEIGKEPGREGATPVIRRMNATQETR
jgi:hypothetical protein